MKKRFLILLSALFFITACDAGDSSNGSKVKSAEKLLTSFWFSADNSTNRDAGITNDLIASINGNDISVTLPFGIQASSLSASFTLADGASASVSEATQQSGITINDFASPLVFRVDSRNGSTESYNVTVNTQWIKTTGTNADDKGKFHTDKNGNIYAIITSDKLLESGELEKTGPFLKKYTPEFTELWSLNLPEENYYRYGIQTDATGNIYLWGKFFETVDFDPGDATDLITASGDSDGFITKILPDGSYGWTKTMGSSFIWMQDEAITSVKTDSDGSIYYSGICYAPTDFDPGQGIDIQAPPFSTFNYPQSCWFFSYLSKLNPDGSYAWTRITRPGTGNSIEDTAFDSENSVLFAGYLRSLTDFDPGPEMDSKAPSGLGDAYFAKYKSDGTYCWAKSFGGEETDIAQKIFTDHDDNIFVTGFFSNTADFDPGDGVDLKTASGYGDCPYISKYKSDGSYAWTKILDSELGGFATVLGSVADSKGNIYVLLDQISFEPRESKIKLSKINTDGSAEWTKTIISSQDNFLAVNNFNIDEKGNIYLYGYFTGTIDINTESDIIQKASTGESDIFILKLRP